MRNNSYEIAYNVSTDNWHLIKQFTTQMNLKLPGVLIFIYALYVLILIRSFVSNRDPFNLKTICFILFTSLFAAFNYTNFKLYYANHNSLNNISSYRIWPHSPYVLLLFVLYNAFKCVYELLKLMWHTCQAMLRLNQSNKILDAKVEETRRVESRLRTRPAKNPFNSFVNESKNEENQMEWDENNNNCVYGDNDDADADDNESIVSGLTNLYLTRSAPLMNQQHHRSSTNDLSQLIKVAKSSSHHHHHHQPQSTTNQTTMQHSFYQSQLSQRHQQSTTTINRTALKTRSQSNANNLQLPTSKCFKVPLTPISLILNCFLFSALIYRCWTQSSFFHII